VLLLRFKDTIALSPAKFLLPDGRPSLLYSRGVGRDCSALIGSAASHSHLLTGPFPDQRTIQ